MATHDYVIDNQTASAFRTDLNNALQAIVTQNSGSSAPATTYANMLWYDTTNNQIKKRNEANSAWIVVGTVDEGTSTFEPNQTFATQAEAEAGTNNTKAMTALRTAQAISALSGDTDYQAFTASGTWTKPPGIGADAVVIVQIIGAGGGGGAGRGSGRYAVGGAGGGCLRYIGLASSLSATVAVTIGSGGAGAVRSSDGSTDGSAGGTTSFGAYAVLPGGDGGRSGLDSVSWDYSGPNALGDGGLTGISYYGAMNTGSDLNITPNGTLSGGAGGSTTHAAGTSQVSGAGGAYTGGTGTRTGGAGSAPGGGGGGAYITNSVGTATGGAGGRGEIRVWTIG